MIHEAMLNLGPVKARLNLPGLYSGSYGIIA
jgi:hypothetical protein